jgi:hypothetical protein
VTALKAANLAVKFGLELAAIAAFADWGANTGSGAVAVVLAVVAPAVAIAVWATWCAPRSPRRLPGRSRVPLELAVFALAFTALLVAGETVLAVIFGAVAVVNAALLAALGQLDE